MQVINNLQGFLSALLLAVLSWPVQAERGQPASGHPGGRFCLQGTTEDPEAKEVKDWARTLEVDQGPKLHEEKREDGHRENKGTRDEGTDKRENNAEQDADGKEVVGTGWDT